MPAQGPPVRTNLWIVLLKSFRLPGTVSGTDGRLVALSVAGYAVAKVNGARGGVGGGGRHRKPGDKKIQDRGEFHRGEFCALVEDAVRAYVWVRQCRMLLRIMEGAGEE